MLRRDEHLHMFTFLTEIQIYRIARPEYQPLTALPDDVRPGPLFSCHELVVTSEQNCTACERVEHQYA